MVIPPSDPHIPPFFPHAPTIGRANDDAFDCYPKADDFRHVRVGNMLCDLPWESLVIMCSSLNGSSEDMLSSLIRNIDSLSQKQSPRLVKPSDDKTNLLVCRLFTACLPYAMEWSSMARREIDLVLYHIEDVENKKVSLINECIRNAHDLTDVVIKNKTEVRSKLIDSNYERFLYFCDARLKEHKRHMQEQLRLNLQALDRST